MSIHIKTDKNGVDWDAVADVLEESGLTHYDAATQRLIFERSYAVSFVYDGEQLIGCGRALSDGVCQAAIYNIALREAYHGRGIGRMLIESLLAQVKGCTVILYTHPRTVALYEKLGFRRSKTAMVTFSGDEEHRNWMEQAGFLLPDGWRFGDNEWERKPKD